MALSLTKIEKAHELLKNYNGSNSYIIKLRNVIFAYRLDLGL